MPPDLAPDPAPSTGRRGAVVGYVHAIAIVAVTAVLASGARSLLNVPDVEMLFLLAVVVVAATSTRGASVFAAALSVVAYDFFFVKPAMTLAVEDARYFLTFAMMLGIGIVISNLTVRLRDQERAAAARERRTAALYDATRRFVGARDAGGVAAACAEVASHVIGAPAVLLERAGDGALSALAAAPEGTLLPDAAGEVARWTVVQGSPAGAGAGPFPEAPVACTPLRASVTVHGVLALLLRDREPLRPEQRDFVEALCRQTALALERVRLAEEVRSADRRAEAEQLRSALLSTVSHDLRTPLATITGAATTLRDGGALPESTRRELVDAICDEAERLERLVRNLLDMTRLESGAVQLRREWIPVEELVGSALTVLERALAGRPVAVAALDAVPLVSVDPVLLEQLLVNLLENAMKYTPRGSPLEVTAGVRDGEVWIEVADRGPGLPAGMEEEIFERFRRGAQGAVPGVGLGLAIGRAIARAHGGTLVARNREGGGAAFTVTLPAVEAKTQPEAAT